MNSNSLVTKEMETFKVRMYTNIPPNAVLVGNSIFTKKPKIYSKALFHMPWFQSRFITLETQNLDLTKEKFEVGSKGLEVISDLAISYKVLPMVNEQNEKYGLKDRWKAFKKSFEQKPIAQTLKMVALGAATVASAFVVGPFCLALPLIAAGYVSTSYQDPEYVKSQGAYNAAYNMTTATKELEQIVYAGLRSFYASYTYEEIKSKRVNLDEPEFADLKKDLDEFSKDRGVVITRISIKSSDLTEESNKILQKEREAEIESKSIKLKAEAQKVAIEEEAKAKKIALEQEAAGLEAIVKTLKDQGLSSQEIANYLRARALSSGDSKTVLLENAEDRIVTKK